MAGTFAHIARKRLKRNRSTVGWSSALRGSVTELLEVPHIGPVVIAFRRHVP